MYFKACSRFADCHCFDIFVCVFKIEEMNFINQQRVIPKGLW